MTRLWDLYEETAARARELAGVGYMVALTLFTHAVEDFADALQVMDDAWTAGHPDAAEQDAA